MARAQTVSTDELKSIAKRIRRHIVQMTAAANSGHPGGSLSSVEIATALYFRVMRYDPQNPLWPDRDRFIVSKGHATPMVYGTMAEAGYFPVEDLMTFRRLGGKLQGHTIMQKPPGVEMSAGALGMGLSFSLGQRWRGGWTAGLSRLLPALGRRLQEGQTWEAAMASAHHQAENLIAIVDRNHIQNDGFSDYQRFPDGNGSRPQRPGGWVMKDGHTANIMNLEPFEDKWKAFGWSTQHIDEPRLRCDHQRAREAKEHTG